MTVAAGVSGTKASAPSRSCARSKVKAGRIVQSIDGGMDLRAQPAATAYERFGVRAPFRACSMLMSTHDSRINYSAFIVGTGRQRLENTQLEAALSPACTGYVSQASAKTLRQITQGNTRPVVEQHRVDRQAFSLAVLPTCLSLTSSSL